MMKKKYRQQNNYGQNMNQPKMRRGQSPDGMSSDDLNNQYEEEDDFADSNDNMRKGKKKVKFIENNSNGSARHEHNFE